MTTPDDHDRPPEEAADGEELEDLAPEDEEEVQGGQRTPSWGSIRY